MPHEKAEIEGLPARPMCCRPDSPSCAVPTPWTLTLSREGTLLEMGHHEDVSLSRKHPSRGRRASAAVGTRFAVILQ